MDWDDLFAPVDDIDVGLALADWNWLLPAGTYEAIVVTALGDLFLRNAAGAVLFIDTCCGRVEPAAASMEEWKARLTDVQYQNNWFTPDLVAALRKRTPLTAGQSYSAIHPPFLGGTFDAENFQPAPWVVHFSHAGRSLFAIKDLPDGAAVTEWNHAKV